MNHAFSTYQARYAVWISKSLELWAARGRDAHGGWYEHLLRDSVADIGAERRHRIQARQVYSYATAQARGWYKGGQAIAEKSFEFMCLQGWQGQHFIHRMDENYAVTDERCDLYDHAFYLLAAASLLRLTGQKIYARWIDKIIAVIDKLRLESGGWAEDNLHSLPRRQNPHMHLFEAHLYLYETTQDKRFLTRARESLKLFKAHFYAADIVGITEFFNTDWRITNGMKGHILEPGHAAEWIWLLGWYDRLAGSDHSHIRERLFDKLARQSGPYLIDETKAPGHSPVRTTRRLWVQTEWIKAHITLIDDGYSPAADMLPSLLDHFMEDYLTPEGVWRDQFDAQGRDIAETIPVSSMYHIIAMIAELDDLVNA